MKLEGKLDRWYTPFRRKIPVFLVISALILLCSSYVLINSNTTNEAVLKVSKEPEQISTTVVKAVETAKAAPSEPKAAQVSVEKQEQNYMPKAQRVVVIKEKVSKEEEEILEDTIVTQYVYNSSTLAVPKQFLDARVRGKQIVTPKSPTVGIELLHPLQLATFTLPKGSFLQGTTTFKDNRAFINISVVKYRGENHSVHLFVTDNLGNEGLATTRKNKLKFENTTIMVVTK